MAYRLKSGEPVAEGARRIALEQIDAALGEIANPDLDRNVAVHEVRKRCKKLRGLLRLVKSSLGEAYAAENAWYRDAARSLSGVRDAESIIEAFDGLIAWNEARRNEGSGAARVAGSEPADNLNASQMSDDSSGRGQENVASVRQALVARRQRLVEQQTDLAERLAEFAGRLGEGRARVASWPLAADGFAAVAGGLERTYRRGRNAMRVAYEDRTPESFHEWRKRVKYGWYHHRLLRDVWKPVMDVRRKLYAELSDLLGDDHDLVVLRQTLEADPAQFGGREAIDPVLDLLERRRKKLQKRARRLGARLYAEKPGAFRRRMEVLWRVGMAR